MVAAALAKDGYAVFPYAPEVARWANAARVAGEEILARGGEFRHGRTWFVGVDALPNATDGSIAGVPLSGPFLHHVTAPAIWHHAQLSVIYPGYPQQDADESDAAHRYRRNRDAAHVDGLLPEGPTRQRHLREPHGFILGLPLNDVAASPLVVWPGSHKVMQAAFAEAYAGLSPAQCADLAITDVYQVSRRVVFAKCPRVEVQAKPGQAVLLHRHLLHGVAPWDPAITAYMRMIAYFRPQVAVSDWL